jgi:hypothetical protein
MSALSTPLDPDVKLIQKVVAETGWRTWVDYIYLILACTWKHWWTITIRRMVEKRETSSKGGAFAGGSHGGNDAGTIFADIEGGYKALSRGVGAQENVS